MPLRRVEPYKPNPRLDRRESHQRGFYKGSFDKNGSEFLTCFMKKAIQIQPLPLQSSLKKFLASFPDIHMGTFCSGTDSPVPWDLSSISHTKTVTLKMCLNCTSNTGNTALRCQRLRVISYSALIQLFSNCNLFCPSVGHPSGHCQCAKPGGSSHKSIRCSEARSVLVLSNMAWVAAVQDQLGVTLRFHHRFACEVKDSKQEFLKTMFPSLPFLFKDACQMQSQPGFLSSSRVWLYDSVWIYAVWFSMNLWIP